MFSVKVSEAEDSGLAYVFSSEGWYFDTDRTIGLWKDCNSPGSVSGAGHQSSGLD